MDPDTPFQSVPSPPPRGTALQTSVTTDQSGLFLDLICLELYVTYPLYTVPCSQQDSDIWQVVSVKSSLPSQDSIPSCGSMIICLFSRWQSSGLFPIVGFINKVATNILVQNSSVDTGSHSSWVCAEEKTARLYSERRRHFTRNRQTVVQSGDNPPHYHCRRMSTSHFTSLTAHGFQFFYIFLLCVCIVLISIYPISNHIE